ncbi:MAG: 50S ribosomal protein L4 [Elusimicrobia bacterium]|nr:50S ribosomal protein L4 [Elusimicrobiota bacterium]
MTKTETETQKSMEATLLNEKGQEVGKVGLRGDVFGLKPRPQFLHEAVTAILANRRQWDANTKTRDEVSGGGKKPWKQKHTGRARAGSSRSPLWRHGGVTFGPRAGKVRVELPRSKSRLALAQALSSRFQDGNLVFIDSLSCEDGRTKSAAAVLKSLGCSSRTIVVLDRPNEMVTRAFRNIPGVAVVLPGDLNAYSALNCRKLVITKAALEALLSRWN